MMTYLMNQVAGIKAFNWWKTEIEERPYELVGPFSVIGGTAFLVRMVWGKQMGVWFMPIALCIYPSLHSSVREYMVLDQKKVAQLAKCLVIPLFCIAVPSTTRILMSLHIVLVGMVLQQQWKDEQVIKKEIGLTNRDVAEEKKRLEDENGKIVAEKQQLERQNQKLAEEKRRLEDENEKIAAEKQQLKGQNQKLVQEKERLEAQNSRFGQEAEVLETQARLLSEKLSILVQKATAYQKVRGLPIIEEGKEISCMEAMQRVIEFCPFIDGPFIDRQLDQINKHQQKLAQLACQIKSLNIELGEVKGSLASSAQQIESNTAWYGQVLSTL